MNCPKCNHANLPEARFCGQCGSALPQAAPAVITATQTLGQQTGGEAAALKIMRAGDMQVVIPQEEGGRVPVPPGVLPLVGRDRFLDDLAQELIGRAGDAPLALTALRGLPGVGKTALALALANRPDVAKAFPGGRAWLPLGPEPVLFDLLGRVLEQFGAASQDLATFDQRADCLRSVLAGKRCLLLLDDVWRTGHALPFVQACCLPARVLLTTRHAQIAADLHAINHEVRVLQPKYAVQMLESSGAAAATAVAADPESAARLAGDLGYLPLALHVAGRRLDRLARADGPAGRGPSSWRVERTPADAHGGRDTIRPNRG